MQQATPDIKRDIAALSEQVDMLTQQVQLLRESTEYLAGQARASEGRQREWDELKEDLTPIVSDMYSLSVEQLEEIEPYVQLDDMLRLLKRLARNTRNFEVMLDQLESLQDFMQDALPLTNDAFNKAVVKLDEMERLGYFGLAREAMGVADKIVDEFNEEDVRLLGDNVVLILNTVKAMTQPEIMNLVNNMTMTYEAIEQAPEELNTSITGLLREMRDPGVRRGLAMTLRLLKVVAEGDGTARQLVDNGNSQLPGVEPPGPT
jgi:uncharacterized protein YjgD (DUF1641 family)